MWWFPLQYVVLLSFMYINHVYAQCEDCDIIEWAPWSNCDHDITCGEEHFRWKHLCCSDNVKPQTFENCLQHCNLTETWWWAHSYEQDTCNTSCLHGPYGDTYRRCKCTTGQYRYSCETGKTL